jgi:phosphonoacetate hydrolase
MSSRTLANGINNASLPNFKSLIANGFHRTVKSTLASAQDPNQTLILAGASTSSHDFAQEAILNALGDYKNVTNRASQPRATIVLSLLSQRGIRVAAVTEEINSTLEKELIAAIYISAQNADALNQQKELDFLPTQTEKPSSFVLNAGHKSLQQKKADVFYLALSNANDVLREIDTKIGRFVELGADVTITGYHSASDETQQVPLIRSHPVDDSAAATAKEWENYDAFDLALNW